MKGIVWETKVWAGSGRRGEEGEAEGRGGGKGRREGEGERRGRGGEGQKRGRVSSEWTRV